MIRIYHNPRCRKSRAGLEYLQAKGLGINIINYLKDEPLTEESITRLIAKLGIKPFELVRTQEDFYKTELKGRTFSDHEWIGILVKNPQLIKRPVIETETAAIIGDPVEEVNKIIR